MIEGFMQWFMQEPLKNLLLLFGSGGVLAACFKWGSRWADRRRIRVRVLSEHIDPKVNPTIEVVLQFEVTNVGEKATSLEPDVVVRSVTPKRKLTSFVLHIQEAVLSFDHAIRHSTRGVQRPRGSRRNRNTRCQTSCQQAYWIERCSFRRCRAGVHATRKTFGTA